MSIRENIFDTIMTSATLLTVFYLFWIIRGVANGELLADISVSFAFGCTIMYLMKALIEYNKGEKGYASVYIVISAVFCLMWYAVMLKLEALFVNGTPILLISGTKGGLFGIKGFWGLGIFAPIYAISVIILTWCVYGIEKLLYMYRLYKFKKNVKIITQEYQKRLAKEQAYGKLLDNQLELVDSIEKKIGSYNGKTYN